LSTTVQSRGASTRSSGRAARGTHLLPSRNRACPRREPFSARIARCARQALQRAYVVLERRTDLFELGCPAYGALPGGILKAHQDFCKLFSTLPTSIFWYRHSKSPDLCIEPQGSCPSPSREAAGLSTPPVATHHRINFRCEISKKNSTESPSVHSRAGKASLVKMSLRPRFSAGEAISAREKKRLPRRSAPRNDMLAGSLTHETEWFSESS